MTVDPEFHDKNKAEGTNTGSADEAFDENLPFAITSELKDGIFTVSI